MTLTSSPPLNTNTVSGATPAYEHARHEPVRRFLRWAISEIGFRWLVRLDGLSGVEHLPASGPAILMINHIAFVDPIVVLGQMPRNIVPIAKREVYNDPLWGVFPRLWGVIPVDRGGSDLGALKHALAVLEAGEVLLIAPEGTRHDALQDVKQGVGYLAYKSGAPIIPVAVEGTRGFPTLSLARHRKAGATVRLGPPIYVVSPDGARLRRPELDQVTQEVMYALAAMLPEHRRGDYADLSKATREYIRVESPNA